MLEGLGSLTIVLVSIAACECVVAAYRLIKLRQRSKGVYAVLVLGSVGMVLLVTFILGSVFGWIAEMWQLVIFHAGFCATATPVVVLSESLFGGEAVPRSDSGSKRQRVLRGMLTTVRVAFFAAVLALLLALAYLALILQ